AALLMCMCSAISAKALDRIWRNAFISERADFDERYFPGLKRSATNAPVPAAPAPAAAH
ncbi:hypothetical protein PLICRDRAFT_61368, partial [Plicaturopsis crispa FD-325 SS-3]